MKNGIFLNMVALYPVAELHFAQKHHFDSSTTVYMCDGALQYCHVNPFGRKAICKYCVSRAEDVVMKLSCQTTIIKPISSGTIANSSINRIENAVMSSIASITRIADRSDLNKTWSSVYFNLLKSSKKIYLFFEAEFKSKLDTLFMFNGRFTWDGSARAAAIHTSKNYFVYDFKKTTSYYEFFNISLHSVDENHRRALSFYLANPKRARSVAKEFIESKISGIPTYEKSYTELQQNNLISVDLDPGKKTISIFPSSDDEYRYLSGEWGAPIVESQIREIWEMVAALDNARFQVVVRMHPNMRGLSKSTLIAYKRIGEVFNDVFVLSPDDPTSTYTLIEKSSIVICFCSTVATEATYMRKIVVNIGGSPYYKLSVANYVDSGKTAANLINLGKLNIMPQRASIIWFYYLWKYSDRNPNINSPDDQLAGKPAFEYKIATPYFLRLMQSPFRAEIEFKKSSVKNFAYFKRLFTSITDIFFNKFSIKL